MSCIASGNLIEVEDIEINLFDAVNTNNNTKKQKYKKFHYFLSISTSAPNIGLIVGHFDEHIDENNNQINFFYHTFIIQN